MNSSIALSVWNIKLFEIPFDSNMAKTYSTDPTRRAIEVYDDLVQIIYDQTKISMRYLTPELELGEIYVKQTIPALTKEINTRFEPKKVIDAKAIRKAKTLIGVTLLICANI